MGTSRTPRELSGKLNDAAKRLDASSRTSSLQGAQIVKTSVLSQATRATGGDLRLSGTRTKRNIAGAKLGVQYDAKGRNVLVRATGPFQLVENDQPAHDIHPRLSPQRRGGVRRRRRTAGAKALVIPGIGFRSSAKATGGSKGRQPWRRGVEAAKPVVRSKFVANERSALRDAFR